MPSRRTVLASAAASIATGATAAGLGGCAFILREPLVPMPLLAEGGPCAARAPVLLVMLPGAYSAPTEFATEGFVTATRQAGVAADVWLADSHLGYFNDRSILRRLKHDVIEPARAQGYKRIWLVGISLGGFGALGYAARHGADIDGIVALAPYLGPRTLLRQIEQAGGPVAWQRTAPPPPADDLAHDVWQWLAAPPAGAPPVYLGFGTEDRLAEGHRQLAGVLRADRVSRVAGGHDWAPWRELWRLWLARGLLSADCGGPTA